MDVFFFTPETKWSNQDQAARKFYFFLKGWTRICCNKLRWILVSGEMLIELRYSWFLAKIIWVMHAFCINMVETLLKKRGVLSHWFCKNFEYVYVMFVAFFKNNVILDKSVVRLWV